MFGMGGGLVRCSAGGGGQASSSPSSWSLSAQNPGAQTLLQLDEVGSVGVVKIYTKSEQINFCERGPQILVLTEKDR